METRYTPEQLKTIMKIKKEWEASQKNSLISNGEYLQNDDVVLKTRKKKALNKKSNKSRLGGS